MLLVFRYAHDFHFFGFILPDLRGYLEKEKEEDSSAEDCIRDYQSPELVATAGCSSLRPPFRKCFKLWKKRSIKNLTSLQPCCVPNMTESKNISIAESPVLCNLYNFRSSLVNFSLSDLRSATHNFSRGMRSVPGFQASGFSSIN